MKLYSRTRLIGSLIEQNQLAFEELQDGELRKDLSLARLLNSSPRRDTIFFLSALKHKEDDTAEGAANVLFRFTPVSDAKNYS